MGTCVSAIFCQNINPWNWPLPAGSGCQERGGSQDGGAGLSAVDHNHWDLISETETKAVDLSTPETHQIDRQLFLHFTPST